MNNLSQNQPLIKANLKRKKLFVRKRDLSIWLSPDYHTNKIYVLNLINSGTLVSLCDHDSYLDLCATSCLPAGRQG
jgi:hypothetical protein